MEHNNEGLPTAGSAAPDDPAPAIQPLIEPQPRRVLTWLVLLAVVAIVLVPLLISEVPREVARWHAAAGMERYLDRELEAALAHLNDAIERDPGEPEFYRLRSQWRIEVQDFSGALVDAGRAVELAPNEADSYWRRSQAHQHLGQHAAAIEDLTHVLQLRKEEPLDYRAAVRNMTSPLIVQRFRIVEAYNGRAYARALGNVDLDEALKDIERALQDMRELRGVGDDATDADDPSLLDTRGYLQYRRGALAEAQRDLDIAVAKVEAVLSYWPTRFERQKHQEIDLRRLRLSHELFKHNVAVIRYHRALVYQALQQSALAQQDLDRVRELGFEPGEQLF